MLFARIVLMVGCLLAAVSASSLNQIKKNM